jgi:hypothetical protein
METKKSKSSGFLSPEDNHLVFSLLGDRVQSLFTTVIQFFVSPHHAEGRVDPVDLALKNRNWF